MVLKMSKNDMLTSAGLCHLQEFKLGWCHSDMMRGIKLIDLITGYQSEQTFAI
jgi:hypothetical protein